jgi:hypothetical protein
MANRLINVPKKEKDYQTEKNSIIQIGQLNGYNETFSKNIIELFNDVHISKFRTRKNFFDFSLPFYPNLTKSLS